MEWRQITVARQFLASEVGATVRDWGGQLPIVLAYPNSYAVGMSSLAVHGLYRWFNDLPGVVCERTFAWLGKRGSASDPLITLESQRSVRDAAVLAISVSFEMDYFNIVSMLRRAAIPLRAEEREEGDPLVLLGGVAVSANPEPLAPVADAMVIGEIEPILGSLVDCLRDAWSRDRAATLENLAKLPGVYVPLLHQGQPVARQRVRNLDDHPVGSSVVTPRAEFGDMHLIEISRGCGRGCRFCLAGHWYRPRRERSLPSLLEQARAVVGQTKKFGLVASAVSDYSRIDELVAGLGQLGATISVSSLRVTPLSPVLVRSLAEGGAKSITMAPEAGSERLRQAINKGVTHDDIIASAELVGRYFRTLKLYFMLGLPGEEDQDVEGLLSLVAEVRQVFRNKVIVNTTPFVPKAHTPYQRAAMVDAETLKGRLARVRDGCRTMGVDLRAEAVEDALIQGVLARGDRQIGLALLAMKQATPTGFWRGLERQGVDVTTYLRGRGPDDPLPWDFVAV